MAKQISLLDQQGYAIVPDLLTAEELCPYQHYTDELSNQLSDYGLNATHAGTRNILHQPWAHQLTCILGKRLSNILAQDDDAIQCTYFEKAADRNWLVPLHQDLSIPVPETYAAQRDYYPSLSGWSFKERGWYAQAPDPILRRLIAVRVHLDDCHATHGPLRVIPGSHLYGRLDDTEIAEYARHSPATPCCVAAGGVVLMKPLVLHASSKALQANRRRVLHFLFAPKDVLALAGDI